MNFETVKSYILVILIGISVLLSLALWTYQPSYEQFQDPDYVSEVNVGGKEKEKKELINPSSLIFHDNKRVLGFSNLADQVELYESMNTWVMYDVEEREAIGKPKQRRFMEIIYPTAFPAKVITDIFTFNEEIEPPNWSFNKIYVTFNEEDLLLDITFVSSDEKKEITARIDKREKYDLLFDYVVNHSNLIDYTSFNTEEKTFYIPQEEINTSSKTLVISKIQPEKLVNALFRNPSQVTSNIAEAYYTDGQRGMSVSTDENKIEFINPVQTSSENLLAIDLLEHSIANVNEHKGWTNDYTVEYIDTAQSKVRFRLMYNGLPVFENNNLTILEQRWRDKDLYEYNRSLIRLTHEVDSTQKKIISGQNLIDYIEKEAVYELEKIDGLQMGYELKFLSSASDSMLLEPTWYVKYQGQWQPVDTNKLTKEGGE